MHFVEKPGTSVEAMHRVTVAGEQGPAGDSRRAQLRLAHRPGRGRRRSRRPELHRAVDQHRPGRRLRRRRSKKIEEVVDAYPGLYRDVLTYLRERIKEVLTGASADDRRAAVRPGPGRAAGQGEGGRGGDGRRCRA